eukprot:GHVH01005758.1.p1 GENE.GHVH01005758.1~~GHVH01005758.1.p1  ORF type:complete len:1183 (+),score=143.58 GHVH01005758.1:2460-6008(+)
MSYAIAVQMCQVLSAIYKENPSISMNKANDQRMHHRFMNHEIEYVTSVLHAYRGILSTNSGIESPLSADFVSFLSKYVGMIEYDEKGQAVRTVSCQYREGSYKGMRVWISLHEKEKAEKFNIDSVLYHRLVESLGLGNIIQTNKAEIDEGSSLNGLQFKSLDLARSAYAKDPNAPHWLVLPSVLYVNDEKNLGVLHFKDVRRSMSLISVIRHVNRHLEREKLSSDDRLDFILRTIWGCVLDAFVWIVFSARILLRGVNCHSCRVFITDMNGFINAFPSEVKSREFIKIIFLDWQMTRRLTGEESQGLRAGVVALENLNLSLLMRALSMMGVQLSRPVDILDVKNLKKNLVNHIRHSGSHSIPRGLGWSNPFRTCTQKVYHDSKQISSSSSCGRSIGSPGHSDASLSRRRDTVKSKYWTMKARAGNRIRYFNKLLRLLVNRETRLEFVERLAIKKVPLSIFVVLVMIIRLVSMRVDMFCISKPLYSKQARNPLNFEFMFKIALRRMRLVDHIRQPQSSLTSKLTSSPTNKFEWKLLKLISDLPLLGCQVSMIHGNRVLVDMAVGRAGPFSNRQITSSSLFSTGNISKLIMTYLLLRHLAGGNQLDENCTCPIGWRSRNQLRAALNTPVSHFWPEFANNGKEEVTMRELLSHSGGLHGCWPEKCTLNLVLNTGGQLEKSIEDMHRLNYEPNLNNPEGVLILGRPLLLTEGRYCYWSDVVMLARILETVTKSPLAEIIKDEIETKLNMKDRIWFPMPLSEDGIPNSSEGMPADVAHSHRGLTISRDMIYSIASATKINKMVTSKKSEKMFEEDRMKMSRDYQRNALLLKYNHVLQRCATEGSAVMGERYAIGDVLLTNLHLFDGELADVPWISNLPVPSLNMRCTAHGLTNILHSFHLNDDFDEYGTLRLRTTASSASTTDMTSQPHLESTTTSTCSASTVGSGRSPSLSVSSISQFNDHHPTCVLRGGGAPRSQGPNTPPPRITSMEQTPFQELDSSVLNFRPFRDINFFDGLLSPLTVDDDLMTSVSLGGHRGLFTETGLQVFPQYTVYGGSEECKSSHATSWGLGSSANSGSIAFSFVVNRRLTSVAINVNDHTTGPHVARKILELLTNELSVVQDDKWAGHSMSVEFLSKCVEDVTKNRKSVYDHYMNQKQSNIARDSLSVLNLRTEGNPLENAIEAEMFG